MNTINSKDGTQIAFEKSGNGTSFIIVGGSLTDHQMYIPLAAELSEKLTVFNYDRRNRGKSDRSENHTIESELEDLKSIISLCDEAPILYGHSAGAALAIRAVSAGLPTSKLILSDLPFTALSENSEQEAKKFEEERSKIVVFLNQNDKEGAVKFFLKDFGMSEQELDYFISSENGSQAIVNSITLPIDYDILGNGLTPRELLRKVRMPTLILTSNDALIIAKDVAKYLTNCKLAILKSPTYSLSADIISEPIFNFLEEMK